MADSKSNEKESGPFFSVHNIYLKDASFEAPGSPKVFNTPWKPKLDFDLQMSSSSIAEDVYEVILHVTVTVNLNVEKEDENVTAFLIETKQAGVFTVKGFNAEQLDRVLSTTCPTVLFPYVREAVSSMVSKGGFPQLVLPPINFDVMYARHLKEQEKETASEK